MMEAAGLPSTVLGGQLVLGLYYGAFYALLSLGLALIFGLLRIVNFAHGAYYTLGAFAAWWALTALGLGYWGALIVAPLLVGVVAVAVERLLLARVRTLDPLYGLLLTFGLALLVEGTLREIYGSSGLPYAIPDALTGSIDLGFMFLPVYRAWVVVAALAVCLGTWLVIERTSLGARLRAATENPDLTRAFGIDVGLLVTATYGFGAALAGFAGALAAPIYSVNPLMGSHLVIVVFAVVVIGGMGSIPGAVAAGFLVGVVEGVTKVLWPEASNVVVFALMAVVLAIRPAGLFGRGGA